MLEQLKGKDFLTKELPFACYIDKEIQTAKEFPYREQLQMFTHAENKLRKEMEKIKLTYHKINDQI